MIRLLRKRGGLRVSLVDSISEARRYNAIQERITASYENENQ